MQGAAKPLLHRLVNQSSTQPNNNGIAYDPGAMARGISNRQVASRQEFRRHTRGRASPESTAAPTDENRTRISSDDNDGCDGNSASNTGNPSGATGKDGSSAAKGAPCAVSTAPAGVLTNE